VSASTLPDEVSELGALSELGVPNDGWLGTLCSVGKDAELCSMVLLAVALLSKSAAVRRKYQRMWTHVHVDEFQDTNIVQYGLLRLLVDPDQGNVFVVGDADQAIYGWRGADERNQHRLENDFRIAPELTPPPPEPLPPEAFTSLAALDAQLSALPALDVYPGAAGVRLRLELNYRSRQRVLDAAMALLKPAYKHDPMGQLNLVAATKDADQDAAALPPLPIAGVVGVVGVADATVMTAARGEEGSQLGATLGKTESNGKVASERANEESTGPIGQVSSAPTGLATERPSSRYTSSPPVQVVAVEDGDSEAAYVVQQILRLQLQEGRSPSVGILYRTNAQAMPIERELLRQGVPYTLVQARSFFQRKEVRDALAYLRLLATDDHAALERIINVPPRRIGASAMAKLTGAASKGSNVPTTASANASACRGLWGTLTEVVQLRAVGEPLPAELAGLTRATLGALDRFHDLIVRYRHRVRPPLGATSADEGAEGSERLVLVGSQLLSRRERGKARIKLQASSGSDGSGGRRSGLSDSSDCNAKTGTRASGDYGNGNRHSNDEGGSSDSNERNRFGSVAETDMDSVAEGSLARVFLQLMAESGYEKMVKSATDGSSSTRWRNLGELASMAAPYAASELQEFLDQVALVSDLDATDAHGTLHSAERAGQEPVKLMTVHASKGLEFDDVFIVGVEEDLLPHYYCTDSEAEVEEERRLLYVAMTRARQSLTLSHAAERSRWGRVAVAEPSRFLCDLPTQLVMRQVALRET